jgi:hypothetical protein
MSATMTPPSSVDVQLDTAPQVAQPVAAPVRVRPGPDAPSSRATHPRASTGRFGFALVTATWASALVVASAIAAVVLAVAQPILLAVDVYERRRYR